MNLCSGGGSGWEAQLRESHGPLWADFTSVALIHQFVPSGNLQSTQTLASVVWVWVTVTCCFPLMTAPMPLESLYSTPGSTYSTSKLWSSPIVQLSPSLASLKAAPPLAAHKQQPQDCRQCGAAKEMLAVHYADGLVRQLRLALSWHALNSPICRDYPYQMGVVPS